MLKKNLIIYEKVEMKKQHNWLYPKELIHVKHVHGFDRVTIGF